MISYGAPNSLFCTDFRNHVAVIEVLAADEPKSSCVNSSVASSALKVWLNTQESISKDAQQGDMRRGVTPFVRQVAPCRSHRLTALNRTSTDRDKSGPCGRQIRRITSNHIELSWEVGDMSRTQDTSCSVPTPKQVGQLAYSHHRLHAGSPVSFAFSTKHQTKRLLFTSRCFCSGADPPLRRPGTRTRNGFALRALALCAKLRDGVGSFILVTLPRTSGHVLV